VELWYDGSIQLQPLSPTLAYFAEKDRQRGIADDKIDDELRRIV
jgi:hypothetical protein